MYPYILATYTVYENRPDGHLIALFTITEERTKKWNIEKNTHDLFDNKVYVAQSHATHATNAFNSLDAAFLFAQHEISRRIQYMQETIQNLEIKNIIKRD